MNGIDPRIVWLDDHLIVFHPMTIMIFLKKTGARIPIKFNQLPKSAPSNGLWYIGRVGGPTGGHLVASDKRTLCCWNVPSLFMLDETSSQEIPIEYTIELGTDIANFQVGSNEVKNPLFFL